MLNVVSSDKTARHMQRQTALVAYYSEKCEAMSLPQNEKIL